MLLERGAVLAFMDGMTIHGFAPLVYKCLRGFVVPVYSSWCEVKPPTEHLLLAVVRDIPAERMSACVARINGRGPSKLTLSPEELAAAKRAVVTDAGWMRTLDVSVMGEPASGLNQTIGCYITKVWEQLDKFAG